MVTLIYFPRPSISNNFTSTPSPPFLQHTRYFFPMRDAPELPSPAPAPAPALPPSPSLLNMPEPDPAAPGLPEPDTERGLPDSFPLALTASLDTDAPPLPASRIDPSPTPPAPLGLMAPAPGEVAGSLSTLLKLPDMIVRVWARGLAPSIPTPLPLTGPEELGPPPAWPRAGGRGMEAGRGSRACPPASLLLPELLREMGRWVGMPAGWGGWGWGGCEEVGWKRRCCAMAVKSSGLMP